MDSCRSLVTCLFASFPLSKPFEETFETSHAFAEVANIRSNLGYLRVQGLLLNDDPAKQSQ